MTRPPWTGIAVTSAGGEPDDHSESELVQAIRESTRQNGSRAGDQLNSRNLQVHPTITLAPGSPVRLVVHRDLILRPW